MLTDDQAALVLARLQEKLGTLPPAALARLINSEAAENLHIQVPVGIVRPDGAPVLITLDVSLAENAPQATTPPIPAEHFADRTGKGN
jgi:hypothetical protein